MAKINEAVDLIGASIIDSDVFRDAWRVICEYVTSLESENKRLKKDLAYWENSSGIDLC